ncbi:MAG TPA: HAD-IA family hydrolase [Acidimicrobiales bacterium]|nr:HAD-IA family hydrolase [Acidimicrobiales bacterium]
MSTRRDPPVGGVPGGTTDHEARPIDAVLFDFGGVLSSSPFETFARYEAANSLPSGFIRSVNATNDHDNAWARLERNELGFDAFCEAFESEARAAGGTVDARALFAALSMDLRPAMVEAARRCRAVYKTGLLTNNFVSPMADTALPGTRSLLGEVLAMFDVVVESSVVGVRKPDPRFYAMACERLGIEPHRAVFLDDLGVNLKPARAMGMVTIKVGDPDQAISELEGVVGLPLR